MMFQHHYNQVSSSRTHHFAMAARRVAFNVIAASSEDDGHPALELNQQNPQTKGWQSDRFCAFPQELTIELSTRCDLVQLQVTECAKRKDTSSRKALRVFSSAFGCPAGFVPPV